MRAIFIMRLFTVVFTTLPRVLLGLIIIVAFPSYAQIYKWVDKHGNVQFSDTDPKTKNVEKISVQAPTRNNDNDEGEMRRLKIVKEYQQAVVEQRWQPVVPKPKPREQVESVTSSHCRQAIIEEKILDLPMPIYREPDGALRPAWDGDTYEGPKNYIDDDDRISLLAGARSDIEHICQRTVPEEEKDDVYNKWVDAEYCKVTIRQLQRARQRNSRIPRRKVAELQEQADSCSSESF